MKKLLVSISCILLSLICVIGVVGCGSNPGTGDTCTHVDADHNQECDECGAEVPCTSHKDTLGDGLCDYCGAATTVHQHRDTTPADGTCDLCDTVINPVTPPECTHVDADHDQLCDECGDSVPCTDHVDVLGDGICDYCGDTVQVTPPACTNHVDANHDQLCDNAGCGAEVPCTDHNDANSDNVCDYCNASMGSSSTDTCPFTGGDHMDIVVDGLCDLCGAAVSGGSVNPTPGEHTHADDDGNCVCDGCGEAIAHVDTTPKDCACDVCGHTEGHTYTNYEVDATTCDDCGHLINCAIEGHPSVITVSGQTRCEACGQRVEKVVLKVSLTADASSEATIASMIEYYNANKTGGSHLVTAQTASDASTTSGTMLSSGTIDVAEVADSVAKAYTMNGFLLPLDSFIESGVIDLSGIYANSIDRYRMNITGDATEDAKIETGAGETLYAVPTGIEPTVVMYNKGALDKFGITVISVAEADLADYNAQNGTDYLPHAFYEYDNDPDGVTVAHAINGVTKYRVFNDQIPLSWEELEQMGEYFSKSYNNDSPTRYTYLSEWWFNFGWSVGGDCLENGGDGYLKFTICDPQANWLVVDSNYIGLSTGRVYKPGEILEYADRVEVNNGTPAANLYELPSQNDAYAQYCKLSMTAEQNVVSDGSIKGIGIAPNPDTVANVSRAAAVSSKLVLFVGIEYASLVAAKNNCSGQNVEWGLCPYPQYREYNEDGTVKTSAGGTPIVGYQTTHNTQKALAICAALKSNTTKATAAAKFINWWCGEEAQTMLLQTGTTMANRASINEKAETIATIKSLIGCYSAAPLTKIAANVMQGDWSYVENNNWITNWANEMNTNVRNGVKPIDTFWAEYEGPTNTQLKSYKVVKFR